MKEKDKEKEQGQEQEQEIPKVERLSKDLIAEKKERLKEIFPEVFVEGKVNFDELKKLLGESASTPEERFGLQWWGKSQCYRTIGERSSATLKPDLAGKKEKDFLKNESQNLFIQGDNLEVLKLLQESLFHQVKMIYIDPPYNTGKEFVYPDKHADNLKTYLEYTKQVDSNGKKFSTNTEQEGRYHSNWLSMMYTRLFVARNLLAEDGVIFISIDDNEQANLKKICDQIFGEDNFIAVIVWHKKDNASFLSKKITSLKEYILFYQKSDKFDGTFDKKIKEDRHRELVNISNSVQERVFKKEAVFIENEKFTQLIKKGSYGSKQFYTEILNDFQVNKGIPTDDIKIKSRFSWSQQKIDDEIKKGGVIKIKKIESLKPIFIKKYSEEEKTQKTFYRPMLDIFSKKIDERVGTTHDANKNLKYFFGEQSADIFPYPKPIELVNLLASNVTRFNKDAIILDFFAGSGTTGDAVMQLNAEDGGNRKFVLAQWDEAIGKIKTPEQYQELTDKKDYFFDQDNQVYRNIKKQEEPYNFCKENKLEPVISSICIERVNRAGEKIKKEWEQREANNIVEKKPLTDIGYKVFTLTEKPKLEGDPVEKLFIANKRTSILNTLINMLAATGQELHTKIETIQEGILYQAGKQIYLLGNIESEKLAPYKDLQINLDGWAEMNLEQFLNLDVRNKENITIIY